MDNHQDSVVVGCSVSIVPDVDKNIITGAVRATTDEQKMTPRQGVKLYPKAIAWSIVISSCILMEGFDLILINSLYAVPAFTRRFGQPDGAGKWQISSSWQSGLSNGPLVGEILGLFSAGIIAEHFGYRKTLLGALTMITGFIFIVFFAQNLPMLLVGEILSGLPWGVFQTLTISYAAEVCPTALRAYLTTYVNFCWVTGELLASVVLKTVSNLRPDEAIAYRLPFAMQWIWPIPLMIGVAFAPESPWWLIRKGRREEAKHSIKRLITPDSQSDIDSIVDMMIYTNEFEKSQCEGASYRDCFRRTTLRRTEIVCITWAIQPLCGSTLMSYSTYFFEQAGLQTSDAFSLSLGQYALAILGTISSFFLMSQFGRRTLYLSGAILLSINLSVIGFIALSSRTDSAAQWAISILLLIFTFTYQTTIGPICFSLVAELSSTRLRNKTSVIARNICNTAGLVTNILTPHMLNPTAWDWGAKSAFFWAGICAFCAVWIFFRLPEPKGRTFAELDIMFEERIPARNFKRTVVNPFSRTFGEAEGQ